MTQPARIRKRRHAALITVAFALFWVPVIIFASLAGEVAEREPLPGDTAVMYAIHSIHSPAWDTFFLFLTAIGEPVVVAGTGAVLLAVCVVKRWYWSALALVTGVGGALGANLILKLVFARSRPSLFTPLVRETSYSFPSGHAMVSSAFVGIVILLVWHTRARVPAIVIGAIVTFLIGLSRIYLGVHYPSDVLAGWCVGVVWAALTGSLLLNRPFRLGHRLAPFLHHKD